MKNIKNNPEFDQQLTRQLATFHAGMKNAGFDVKIAKLFFHPLVGGLDCPCGTETVIDPVTHKLTTRCRRCV
jgi:hypothetical protein